MRTAGTGVCAFTSCTSYKERITTTIRRSQYANPASGYWSSPEGCWCSTLFSVTNELQTIILCSWLTSFHIRYFYNLVSWQILSLITFRFVLFRLVCATRPHTPLATARSGAGRATSLHSSPGSSFRVYIQCVLLICFLTIILYVWGGRWF
jgi:hypothetical protein